MKRTCDHCTIQHICGIMDRFKQPLLDTRLCIKFGSYPDLVAEVYETLAKYCVHYNRITLREH